MVAFVRRWISKFPGLRPRPCVDSPGLRPGCTGWVPSVDWPEADKLIDESEEGDEVGPVE